MSRKEKSLRLKGFAKLFHKLFLLITFPIRHLGIFIPLLIIAYLAPTFMGAKPTEVHLWYWDKIKHNTDNLSSVISEKTQAIMPVVDNINLSMPSIDSFKMNSKPLDQVVETSQNTPQTVRRKMFEKAKGDIETIDVLKTVQNTDNQVQIAPQIQAETSNAQQTQSVETKKKLALIFVDQKEEITGTARVVNANEIEMNGKSYFLHGIYIDPNTQKGYDAGNFLRKIIGENTIKCIVQAYTYQGIGTVRCYLKGEDINLMMVNEGYSKNVAL